MEDLIVYAAVGLSALYLIRFVFKKFTKKDNDPEKCITCKGCPFSDSCNDDKKGTL